MADFEVAALVSVLVDQRKAVFIFTLPITITKQYDQVLKRHIMRPVFSNRLNLCLAY